MSYPSSNEQRIDQSLLAGQLPTGRGVQGCAGSMAGPLLSKRPHPWGDEGVERSVFNMLPSRRSPSTSVSSWPSPPENRKAPAVLLTPEGQVCLPPRTPGPPGPGGVMARMLVLPRSPFIAGGLAHLSRIWFKPPLPSRGEPGPCIALGKTSAVGTDSQAPGVPRPTREPTSRSDPSLFVGLLAGTGEA
jgi:hypothetical protein